MSIELQDVEALSLSDAERALLFEIVEKSLHIGTQEDFFKWTQTELQGIFPHGKLVCGTGHIGKTGAHVRHVMGCNFPDEYVQALQRADGLTSSPIIVKWMK